MRVTAFAHELFALGDAELVLLVDDDKAEIAGRETGFDEGVGADEESSGFL
jgi:hypothetical protein